MGKAGYSEKMRPITTLEGLLGTWLSIDISTKKSDMYIYKYSKNTSFQIT